jgi:hypothetical protein
MANGISSCGTATRFGGIVTTGASAASDMELSGTWAVTAP